MINPATLAQIKNILFHYIDPEDYSLFIFGSRVTEKNRKYSDIDIGIEGKKPLELKMIASIQDAFEESDLPYTIDIVDFATVSDRFKEVAKRNIFPLTNIFYGKN